MRNVIFFFTLSVLFIFALPFGSMGQGFTVPLCTPTLQITQGPSHIVCMPTTACTWSWSGPGLTFGCPTCQVTTITAPATGIYTATVHFSGQSNGSITYSISFGYVDADNDLFNRCEDCNDNNALERPGQLWYRDFDNDGHTPSLSTYTIQCQRPLGHKAIVELISAGLLSDCDDNNANVKPGGIEVCDGLDNNCAGGVDEGVLNTYYRDQDGDGFGNPAITQTGCSQPGGYVTNNTDCADNSSVQRPGQTWYKDTDNDGYGAMGVASIAQCLRPPGYKAASELTATATDCNDNSALERPGQQWYRDNDNDGHGQPGSLVTQCSRPTGYKHSSELTSTGGDCNDNDANIRPGATEILCNNIDEDCSGAPAADNALPSAVCKNITVTLVNNTATITGSQLDNGSSDNCSEVSFSANPTTFNCSHLGQTVPVVLTVTDGSNNSATCTAQVTVIGSCEGSCPASGPVLFATAPTPSQTGTVVNWTAPSGGGLYKVRIAAKGAKGGNSNSGLGAAGATITGDFILSPNSVLEAIAGAPGGDFSSFGSGGGGGGSGVRIQNGGLLIVAGGGGGGAIFGSQFGTVVAGNGSGGTGSADPSAGGGGGGFLSNGGNGGTNGCGDPPTGGGAGFSGQGGTGRACSTLIGGKGGGGFGGGGGGSASDNGGGGGGGYTGGNCGRWATPSGGGGSINFGAYQSSASGTNNAGGQVIIECLGAATFTANVTATQPGCSNPTQGSLNINLTGDNNGNTFGLEYAIVAGSNFSGSPVFSDITADPFNITSGFGTTGDANGETYTVRIRLKYNPSLCIDHTYTITELNVGTIYVKQNASGANNGTSWTDAYADLQTALGSACPGSQIWVAAGTYKPTTGTDRTISFVMKNGVALYGGFAGTETQLSQRNWTTNVTTLSGDLSGNDVITGSGANLSISGNDENSYHVISNYNTGIDASAILDGFTIKGGMANGGTVNNIGAGMLNRQASPTMNNCTFTGNYAMEAGAGMYNRLSTSSVTNCVFLQNYSAQNGGGLVVWENHQTISNCIFSGNYALNGGGIYSQNTSFSVINCRFTGNGAYQGAGMTTAVGGIPVLVNCSFAGNSATVGSSLITFSPATPVLTNCILWGNGDEIYNAGSNLSITHSIIQGGYSPCANCPGGNGDLNPLFVNAASGDLRLQDCSPAIDAGTSMGAPATDFDGNPRVDATPGGNIVDIGAYEFQGVRPPVAPVCQNITVQLGMDNTVTVAAAQLNNGSTGCGNLSYLINGQPSLSFDCDDLDAPTSVTLTVTDTYNSTATCSATITVADDLNPCCAAPVAICKPYTAVLNGDQMTVTVGDVDNGSTAECGLQSITVSPNQFNCSQVGSHTVTLTITDIRNESHSCQTTVTVVDNTPPTITCPTTQTLVLGANCGAVLPDYTSLATTGDNCGVQSVTQSPLPGTPVSGSGNMTVTLTVTDANNLTNTCTFTVTKVDNTPPTITCPTTQTLVLGANCGAVLPDYTSLATTGDNCGVQSVTQSPLAGTPVSDSGNMTVTLTVTDVNNLTNTCTFTVAKVDNTPPTITCPATQTLVLGANCGATLPDYTSLATTGDNCGVQSVTQSPVPGTTVSNIGNMTITLMVRDVNNLTSTCTFTVSKVDQTPPTVVCKSSIVFLNAAGTYTLQSADVFDAPASSDNCSGELIVTNISPAMVDCSQLNQIIPVTVTVRDGSGNTSICTAQVTVQEGTVLPNNWSSSNVGNANGSAGYKACSSNGSFTVTANGFSNSSSDVLHLASRSLCGNGEIIARVANVASGGWAGITLRESLEPGSKKVALKTQLSNMIRREIRTATNAPVNLLNFNRPTHIWLRLVRNGSNFTGYTSANGSTWDFAFTATIPMSGCIYAGLFAESINTNVETTANFDNVSIIGGSSSLGSSVQNLAPALDGLEVLVYPNPNNGEMTLAVKGTEDRTLNLKVMDAFGKIIRNIELNEGAAFTYPLDLTGEPAGVYYLRLRSESGVENVQRIVLQH